MALKTGVGFRIRPNALSHIEASGGSDRRTVSFNLSADMYNVEGTHILSDNEQARVQKLKRYFGGDEKFWNYVPQGGYGEQGRVQAYEVLEAMYNAWKADVDVNSDGKGAWYFEGDPEDHTGDPNLREQTDCTYAMTKNQSDQLLAKYRMYIPENRRPGEPGEPQQPQPQQPRPQKPPKQEPNMVPPVQPVTPSPPSSIDLSQVFSRIDALTRDLNTTRESIAALTKKIEDEARQNDKQMRTLLTRSKELLDRR